MAVDIGIIDVIKSFHNRSSSIRYRGAPERFSKVEAEQRAQWLARIGVDHIDSIPEVAASNVVDHCKGFEVGHASGISSLLQHRFLSHLPEDNFSGAVHPVTAPTISEGKENRLCGVAGSR